MHPVAIQITPQEIKKLRKIEIPSPLKNLSEFFTPPKKTTKSASRSLEFEKGSGTEISTSGTTDFPKYLFFERKDSKTSEHLNETENEDEYNISEYQKLLPDVIKTMVKAGKLDLTFLSFFRQVSENRLLFSCLGFVLFGWLSAVYVVFPA